MELRQLRHFIEIVRSASFGQAAEKLHITQPALSKSIRNLERTLGVQLLERHPGGVVPTDYGTLFLDYATLVTTELERAVEEINQLRGRGKGMVRVGAGATMMQYLLPQAVRAFVEGDAAGSVTFEQGLRADLLARLRRGEIDIVVGSINPDQVDDDLRQELILEDRIAVVAAEGHPLVLRHDLTLANLAPYRWVLPDGNEAETDRLGHAFRRAGLPPPPCVVRTASSVFMASVLKDSSYLSYLPQALISMDPDYAHLVPLDLAEQIWPRVVVGVTYRRRGVMLPPVRRFINRLGDVGRKMQQLS
ncbi:LysR family transcriptional regulator [Sphingomonas sp. GlSt437]|uniref:LysR family transcriptional regulator n=1 Tax=Sphingomonas sp. GlSt437 TaxID=3389970 RepID=UPI003A878DA8